MQGKLVKWLLLGSAAAFVAAFFSIGYRSAPPTRLSRPAPHWTLPDIQGQTLNSADWKGKVVIVDFWATWCPPCVKEIPGLVKLGEQYRQAGLVIVGLSVNQDGRDVVQAFVREHRVTYPVALASASVQQAFGGIQYLPTTFIINRAGRIVFEHVGYTARTEFEQEITPLLQEQRPSKEVVNGFAPSKLSRLDKEDHNHLAPGV